MKYCVRNKHWLRLKIFIIVVIVIAATIALNYYWRSKMLPVLTETAHYIVKQRLTALVNDSVYVAMYSNTDDIVNIEYGADGGICYVSVRQDVISLLSHKTVSYIQNNLSELSKTTIAIPAGTLSGSPLLTGLWNDIEITVSPIGNAICTLRSEFSGAGVNQTIHRLYFDITIETALIMPLYSVNDTFVVPVLLAENVIVGDVPTVFVG